MLRSNPDQEVEEFSGFGNGTVLLGNNVNKATLTHFLPIALLFILFAFMSFG
jgi:hypothetical protein